jgi:hypothetical protein
MRRTLISKPYEVEMVHDDDDRLIAVNIRAVGDGNELDHDTIREATRSLLDHFRREQYRTTVRRPRADSDSEAVREMVDAYNKGQGRVTDEYLARLAVAYEELVPEGRSVSIALTQALDGKLPTIKGHIMRARREGFLTDAIEGREGGEATPQARELIAKLAET